MRSMPPAASSTATAGTMPNGASKKRLIKQDSRPDLHAGWLIVFGSIAPAPS
jgi:hypothetical protein